MFPLDTKITMADGSEKELGKVVALDEVLGGDAQPDKVEEINAALREIYRLRFVDESWIDATGESRVFVGSWRFVKDLPQMEFATVGSPMVLTIDGKIELYEKGLQYGVFPVRILKLRRQHGFFANGFLVHDG